jgi:hypothetical protein
MEATCRSKKRTQTNADISCKSITDLIWKYLGGRLDPNLKLEFEAHLRICPDCVNFLKTYNKTISLARSIRSDELPARLRANVRAFLRQKIRRLAAIYLFLLGSVIG